MSTLSVLAHAKVNLSLRVLAREESGYHQIETVFCALELADQLEVTLEGDDVVLDVLRDPQDAGASIDTGPAERNLAVRAAEAFRQATGIRAGVGIRLTKRIPAGAGLGGGSSDAAAVLRALNRLHGEPLDSAALLELGGTLGSDVPFFLTGAALALAWGRGDRLAPFPPLPSRPVVLVVPETGVATADAYARLATARTGQVAGARLAEPPLDWATVEAGAVNEFEPVVFARLPELRELQERLGRAGAAIARLAGSGSVVYGVFREVATAESAAERLRDEGRRVLVTRTREAVD